MIIMLIYYPMIYQMCPTVFTFCIVVFFCYPGLIISGCLPIHHSDHLIGVACVDIVVSELLSDVTYFHQGALSYAFVADETGRTILHPLMPSPTEVTDDPIFVYLTSLEREGHAKDILVNIMQ